MKSDRKNKAETKKALSVKMSPERTAGIGKKKFYFFREDNIKVLSAAFLKGFLSWN